MFIFVALPREGSVKGEFSKSNIHLLKSFRSANMERSTTDGKPKPRKRNFSLKAGEERAKFRLTWLSVQKNFALLSMGLYC